jgi:hypothetical protein
MIAQKEKIRSQNETSSKDFPIYFFMLAVFAFLLLLFAKPSWKDVVRKDETGEYVLQDWREDERILELDRNEEAEQYRLIAKVSGYYFCYFCTDQRIWVEKGETLKIGITTNRNTRYTESWLEQNSLLYVVDLIGNLAIVRQAEIDKIAQYPLWPENLKRSEEMRLVVPPYHRTFRLK